MSTLISRRSSRATTGLAVIIWIGACIGFWCVTNSETHFAGNVVASYVAFWGLFFLVSDRDRADRTLCFLVTTLTVGIPVAGFELLALAGLVDYRGVFGIHIVAPWRDPAFLADRELIFINPPNKQISGMSGGDFSYLYSVPESQLYRYDLRYDENGFRNPPGRKSAEIAVVGDSFIEGIYVSDSELITSVLERELAMTVVKFGIRGYGPYHELAVLRRYALPMKPKVVVWTFFEGNDLKNVYDYEEATADWKRTVAQRFPFAERSFTKNALRALTSRTGKPLPSGLTRSGLVRDADGKTVRTYFLIPANLLSSRDAQALFTTEGILGQAHQSCSSHDAKLIVVFIPTKFRVYHSVAKIDLNSELRQCRLSDLLVQMSAMVRRTSADVGYLDLTPYLAAAVDKGVFPYFHDDPHWSARGHRIAAEAIREYNQGDLKWRPLNGPIKPRYR